MIKEKKKKKKNLDGTCKHLFCTEHCSVTQVCEWRPASDHIHLYYIHGIYIYTHVYRIYTGIYIYIFFPRSFREEGTEGGGKPFSFEQKKKKGLAFYNAGEERWKKKPCVDR